MKSILNSAILLVLLTPNITFADVGETVSFQDLVNSDMDWIGVQVYKAEQAASDKDYNTAAAHYIRAIKLGLPDIANNLAEIIKQDKLSQKHILVAVAEVEKFAAMDVKLSAFLGDLYSSHPKLKNENEAFKWFNNAMLLGDTYAKRVVGNYVLNKTGGADQVYGVADALTLLKQYSDKTSDPATSLQIARFLYDGNIIKRDYKTSALLFKKAAAGGAIEAYYWLGYMHEKGIGVTKNAEDARNYYISSLGSTKDKDTYFQLARMYMYGADGITEDMVKGLGYLGKSHKLGNVRASYRFGTMYLYGTDDFKIDSDKAVEYLDAAAQGGYRLAIQKLIEVFKNGTAGILPSHKKTREYEKILREL